METLDLAPEKAEQILHFKLPAYTEIPDIGLYLEQTTKFVTECLAPLEGISITGSMISNYVKKKMISNPVKKQYYREQIADIIFIAIVKSVLSLEDAQKMLKLQQASYDCRAAYEYFCAELENVIPHVFGLTGHPAPISKSEPAEKQLLRKVITAVAYQLYLDQTFACISID